MTSDLVLDKNNIWVDNELKTISYPDEGNNTSFEVEEKSFWFQQRNEILKTVFKRFPYKNNYADIGGGNGFQAKFIADNFSGEVFLLEPGYSGCLNAKKRGVKNVFNIVFQKFDFKINNVSAVGLFDVIEHIENDVDFLTQLKNCLPSDSLIYITVPAYKFLWSDLDEYGGHFRRYTLSSLKKLATDANLKVVYASYFFAYLPAITFFLRTLPFKLRSKRKTENILTDAVEQHQPASVITKIFNFFHRIELPIIRKKSIPFGASCMMILKT